MPDKVPPNTKWIDGCCCPHTGGTRKIGTTTEYLDVVARYKPRWILHTFHKLVPQVLKSPDGVWDGVREPDPNDDLWGYCFHKHFANKIGNEGNSFPNAENQVLSVYLSANFLIYEIRWDDAEQDGELLVPNGCGTRFGKRLK